MREPSTQPDVSAHAESMPRCKESAGWRWARHAKLGSSFLTSQSGTMKEVPHRPCSCGVRGLQSRSADGRKFGRQRLRACASSADRAELVLSVEPRERFDRCSTRSSLGDGSLASSYQSRAPRLVRFRRVRAGYRTGVCRSLSHASLRGARGERVRDVSSFTRAPHPFAIAAVAFENRSTTGRAALWPVRELQPLTAGRLHLNQ